MTFKKVIFWTHLIIGVTLGLVILWMCATGAVLAFQPQLSQVLGKEALHRIEEWHRWLGNRDIGRPITRAAAIGFFALACSGIYLWWPRKVVAFAGRGHARDWNWHNTFGILASLSILLITSTGFWMSVTAKPHRRENAPPAIEQQVARKWLKPLHTGRVLGWPGQFLQLLAALAGLIQIWSGFALAFRRYRRRRLV